MSLLGGVCVLCRVAWASPPPKRHGSSLHKKIKPLLCSFLHIFVQFCVVLCLCRCVCVHSDDSDESGIRSQRRTAPHNRTINPKPSSVVVLSLWQPCCGRAGHRNESIPVEACFHNLCCAPLPLAQAKQQHTMRSRFTEGGLGFVGWGLWVGV
jgi:hypothetical protein